MDDCSRCCVAVMMGLPAAGKTTWAKRLANMDKELLEVVRRFYSEIRRVVIHVVEFDKEIGILGLGVDNSDGIWKNKRSNVHKRVENLIQQFLSCPNSRDSFLLVILDDNMFYKSMRRIYYSLSQRLRCGFLQIVVQADSCLEHLVSLDENRESPVGESTIVRMSERIEYPDVSTRWERFSCFLEPCWNPNAIQVPDSFLECFRGSLIALEEMTELSKEQILEFQSIRHSVELSMRAIVNLCLKELKNTLPPNQKSTLGQTGKQVSEYKREFFLSLPNIIAPADVPSLLQEFQTHIQDICAL